jgi:predicted Rossmann-fold nucleotide-binding protein
VRHKRGRVVEVDSLEELDRRLASGARSLDGWRLRALDLTAYGDQLAACEVAGATFLGCTLAPGVDAALGKRGALVLPKLRSVSLNTYRTSLYAPEDLYDAPAYLKTHDAHVYAWSRHAIDQDAMLARTLHDHSIDDALAEWVEGRRLVGVMGGHAQRRDEPAYADAARLAHAIGGTLTVTTGGGPGAMEAANLGACLSRQPVAMLDDALGRLAAAPSFRPSVDEWLAPARAVLDTAGERADSLGIPTWHYGHEPTNLFATAIAKYFRNALRESMLVQICSAGVVFLPGAGGTVQEVFQDACENYYADESSVAPMVLVGAAYWTETVPAWPLLAALASGRPMEKHVHLVDTVEEASDLLVADYEPDGS